MRDSNVCGKHASSNGKSNWKVSQEKVNSQKKLNSNIYLKYLLFIKSVKIAKTIWQDLQKQTKCPK